jgi:hypothetical protein
MTDFAAAPVQPIVSGLVTLAAGVWSFSGKGCLPAVGHTGAGIFLLGFDPGLPGNAGAVQPLPVQVRGFPPDPTADPDVRSIVMVRGPFPSGIFNIAVRYITSPFAGVGAPVVQVLFANAGNVLTDPPAGGFDLIVWKGLGGDRAGPQLNG